MKDNNKSRNMKKKNAYPRKSDDKEVVKRGGKPKWLNEKAEVVVSDYTNDVEFYNEQPVMFAGANSLSVAAGQGYLNPDPILSENVKTGYNAAYPGFMRLDFVTGPGYAAKGGTGVNISNNVANNLFTKVRMNKSGTAPYTKADLMMYIMYMDELYMQWFELRRAIGIYNIPHPVNGYKPDDFLQFLGFSTSTAATSLDIARAVVKLNYLGTMINQWPIPTDFKMVQRHADMLSAIYTDDQSMRCQYMAFSRAGYRKWDDTGSTGTVLKFQQYTTNTLEAEINVLEECLVAFQESESASLIRADIITAYQDKGSYKLPNVDTNFMTPIVFDSVINMQIQNADIVNFQTNSLDITETADLDGLNFTPTTISGVSSYNKNTLFFEADTASPEMVAEATRLKVMYESTTENSMGTEFIKSVAIWLKGGSSINVFNVTSNAWKTEGSLANANDVVGTTFPSGGVGSYLSRYMAFKVRPYAYLIIANGDTDWNFGGYLNDVCLTVPITAEQLGLINTVCVNSMFGLLSLFNGRSGTMG